MGIKKPFGATERGKLVQSVGVVDDVLEFFVIGVVVGVVAWTICGYAGTMCWVTSTIAEFQRSR